MQVQHESFQDANASLAETIQKLQLQVDNLQAENDTLREQLGRKEQFMAMIVHELRNPLSPIINYAQLLSNHICEPVEDKSGSKKRRTSSIQRGTSIIIGQTKRLSRLINDLLDSTRLTSGHFILVRELCNLSVVVQEIVDSVRPVAPYHSFAVDVPELPVMGNWDSGRLQQVLGNLLDNAVKYSDEHTTITIRVWTTPDLVHVSVHNQGASIPSSDIELLFQPYTRLKATSTRPGMGLGLYIARSIIEAHGGTLRLEPHTDKAVDETAKGTTFSFDLPL